MKYYIILRLPKDRSVINNCVLAPAGAEDRNSVCLYGIYEEKDLERYTDHADVEEEREAAQAEYGEEFDYEIMEVDL